MRAKARRYLTWVLFTLVHAALTIILFIAYVEYAMKVDHGVVAPSMSGEIAQYVKTLFLLPLLLPLVRWRADLVTGISGYAFLLLNSSLWTCGSIGISRVIRRRRQKSP
jgi:hypothetical protein